MEIEITNTGTTVLRTTHRGQELIWPTTMLWMKLSGGGTDTASVYGPLNEYWHILPMDLQDEYQRVYVEAFELIEMETSFEVLQIELRSLVTRLLNLVNHEHLRSWVLEYGRIAYNSDIHDHYTGEYPRRQTYLKDEYNELVVLSMYFKMVTPIWGKFMYVAPPLDPAFKELVTYDLLKESCVHRLPAMDRLKDYCEALAEKDSKALTPAICTHMGTSEIPRFYLAMVIVRRISIGEFRDSDKTLIKIAYKFLESKAKNLSNGVRDKRITKSDSDETESVVERYRISQSVPDYAVVAMTAYVDNVPAFVTGLNPQGNVDKALGYIDAIQQNMEFSIGAYHLPLIGLVCKRVIYPRTCQLVKSRDTYLRMIGVTAAWLSDHGYQGLANMMLSCRIEKDPSTVDLYSVGGVALLPLSKGFIEPLEEIYPHQRIDVQGRSQGNPGIMLIDNIVSEINLYEWPDKDTVPTTLRNDIARLICQVEDYVLPAQ